MRSSPEEGRPGRWRRAARVRALVAAGVLAFAAGGGCAGSPTAPAAESGRRVTAEPAVFTGYVQVVEGEAGEAPQVILSTATRDIVAAGDLVPRLAALDGKRVRVEGRWIDRGNVPVLEVEKIGEP